MALARLAQADLDGAEHDADDAIVMGEQTKDDRAVCLALCAQAWVALGRSDLARAVGLAEDAVARAGHAGSRPSRYAPHFFLGSVLNTADRLDEAAAVLAVARRHCETTGNLVMLPSTTAASPSTA